MKNQSSNLETKHCERVVEGAINQLGTTADNDITESFITDTAANFASSLQDCRLFQKLQYVCWLTETSNSTLH